MSRPRSRRWSSSASKTLALAAVADTIWSVVGILGGAAGIAVLVWAARNGHDDRDAEDAARDFYDLHGRWPDEPA